MSDEKQGERFFVIGPGKEHAPLSALPQFGTADGAIEAAKHVNGKCAVIGVRFIATVIGAEPMARLERPKNQRYGYARVVHDELPTPQKLAALAEFAQSVNNGELPE